MMAKLKTNMEDKGSRMGSCTRFRSSIFHSLFSLKHAAIVSICCFALSATRSFAAERFGDITVAPQSLSVGETFHGYHEFRVLLQNESTKDTHRVTLIYPDRAFSYGNSISRMSRTVVLAPASQALVSLWQPPLPANGSGNYRVVVDDEVAGTVPGGWGAPPHGARCRIWRWDACGDFGQPEFELR